MKSKLMIYSALLLGTAQTVVLGQKTEVSVKKGEVIAQTESASVALEAGRKAILEPNKNPIVTVDDPMVDNLLQIYKWVEQEKQAQREKISSTSIFIYSLENRNYITFAGLMEFPNEKPEASDRFRLGQVSPLLMEPKFYDLDGRLLPFELEEVTAQSGYYALRFFKPVQPGEKFSFISVSKANDMANWGLWKDGPLWNLRGGNGVKDCLNYYRVILPESAVFVDSSRPVTTVDTFARRVAVTVRNYTGPLADSMFHIAFLWPEKDNTSLADLPPQYRGLRDPKEQHIAELGRVEMAKILAGETFRGQANPLETLLAAHSAILHKDQELFLSLIADPETRNLARQHIDVAFAQFAPMSDTYEFLGTPDWPEHPENRAAHPVYLCRRGSHLCEATIEMVYQDGKWYLDTLHSGRKGSGQDRQTGGRVTVSRNHPDLSAATYQGLEPAKFMTRWLFLGPVPIPWHGQGYFPDEETAKKNFLADDLPDVTTFASQVKAGEKEYEWAVLESQYGVVDLTQAFDNWFVAGYAWAQIDMAEDKKGFLGIGSDDSVKVWLNGQLVHQNWVLRGVWPDNDRVPVQFRRGQNQLVLKIQNGGGAWGFSCRLLDE
jgi:hypothetical protein